MCNFIPTGCVQSSGFSETNTGVLNKKRHVNSLMDFVFKYQNSLNDNRKERCRPANSGCELTQAAKHNDPYVLSHDDIITGIQDILLIPRRFPSIFREYNIAPPTGILLYGPSGTGLFFLLLFCLIIAAEE